MPWGEQLGLSWPGAGMVVVAAAGIYLTVVLYTRLMGQRTLAHFATFDFAVAVAMGAIVGRVTLVHTSLAAGVLGLGTIFLAQAAINWLRYRPSAANLIDNPAVLIMAGPRVLHANLRRCHMTERDLRERLRGGGVHSLREVRAVVMERNGTISILKGDRPIDPWLLDDLDDLDDRRQVPGVGST